MNCATPGVEGRYTLDGAEPTLESTRYTKPYQHETWQNWPNLDVLWKGTTPTLEITGPGFGKQPVPETWFRRVAR